MKNKFSTIWRVMVALVLVASLGMVFWAAPMSAEPDGVGVSIIEYPGGIVEVCQNFGIKAVIHNNTGDIARDVTASISIDPSDRAELVEGMPETWELGNMDVDETDEVGWTLHCTGPGDVTITVTTNYGGSDSCIVEQKEPADLEVEITNPPSSTKICTSGCDSWNEFTVDATVYNDGDVDAEQVLASISATGPGTVSITPNPAIPQDLGIISGNSSTGVSWDVACTGAGDVTFTVTATGFDAESGDGVSDTSDPVTVHQQDFITEITGVTAIDPPAYGYVVSTEQHFTVTAHFRNCSGANMYNAKANLLIDPPGLASVVGSATQNISNLCNCCDTPLTWELVCDAPGAVTITVELRTPDNITLLDSDSVEVNQEAKAHLRAGEAQVWVDGTQVDAVAVCQDFDIVVPVTNEGDADAYEVSVTVNVTGGYTDCDGQPTVSDITIPGGQTVPVTVVSGCHCDSEGDVTIEVYDDPGTEDVIEGLQGKDVNTEKAIPVDNIEIPCGIVIQQIPFTVEIIQPTTSTNIDVCTNFTVKAMLTNDSTVEKDLEDVAVTLHWEGDASLLDPDLQTVMLEKIAAGTTSEATWTMHCDGEGDVMFAVVAESAQGATPQGPHLTVLDIDAAAVAFVTIHQIPLTPADVSVEILSPGEDTNIATSQDFALTAVITNEEPYATITVESAEVVVEGAGSASVLVPVDVPFDITDGKSEIVTWTLHCEEPGDTSLSVEVTGTDELGRSFAETSDPVVVNQYPAVHLEVEITNPPPDEVTVCDEFSIGATITNTGWADAWEVSATLSVFPEGSARVVEGGYTQPVGTLAGHGQEGSHTVIWKLHCKEACESTITITATGYDEYGLAFSKVTTWFEGETELDGYVDGYIEGYVDRAFGFMDAEINFLGADVYVDGHFETYAGITGFFTGDISGYFDGTVLTGDFSGEIDGGTYTGYLDNYSHDGLVDGYFAGTISGADGGFWGNIDGHFEGDAMGWFTGSIRGTVDAGSEFHGSKDVYYQGYFDGDLNGWYDGYIDGWINGDVYGWYNDSYWMGYAYGPFEGNFRGLIYQSTFDGIVDGYYKGTVDSTQFSGTFSGGYVKVVDYDEPTGGMMDAYITFLGADVYVDGFFDSYMGGVTGFFTGDISGYYQGDLDGFFDGTIDGMEYTGPYDGSIMTLVEGYFDGTIDGQFWGNMDGDFVGDAMGMFTGYIIGDVADGQEHHGSKDVYYVGDFYGDVSGWYEGYIDADVDVSLEGWYDGSYYVGPYSGSFVGYYKGNIYGGVTGYVDGYYKGTVDSTQFSGTFSGPYIKVPAEIACEIHGYVTGYAYVSGWITEWTMTEAPGAPIPQRFIEPASFTVKQVAEADLEVTKDVNYSSREVGQQVTFTIIVTNNGPADATGVRVTDLLPSGVNYVTSSVTKGWYDVTSGIWHVGDLVVDGSAVLYITAKVNKVGDINNIATITACDQPDPTTSNNSAMATVTGLEPAPVTEKDIELDEDWNLVSMPLYIPLEDRAPEDLLAGIISDGLILDRVDAYDACEPDPALRWKSFSTTAPGDLTEMRDGPGYWFKMNSAATLTVEGTMLPEPPETPPAYQVCVGWNLIGFKSTVPRTPSDYLAAIPGQYTIIYGYYDGKYFIAGSPGHEYLEPGLGYWIAVIEPGTIYP